ncbi:MAG: helix-turn-helix domain-containing protein [Candidatus Lokiarchaeota archaeon]|nr:helix-turn-helix domain-containing protein [Candidatus Harpocratesius repetitus]
MTISEISSLLGVTLATLRRWDKKGYLVPKRTFGNHRRYSWEQLADFLPESVNLPSQQAE